MGDPAQAFCAGMQRIRRGSHDWSPPHPQSGAQSVYAGFAKGPKGDRNQSRRPRSALCSAVAATASLLLSVTEIRSDRIGQPMNAQRNALNSCLAAGLICLLASVTAVQRATAQVPSVGRSGLPWNAGVYNNNASASSVAGFEAWRGRPVDSILWFATRLQWDQFDNDFPPDVTNFPGIKVLAVPPFPESLGTAGLGQVAAGTHNGRWVTFGQSLVAAGLNNNKTVIRIGWEMNGNWYVWSATTGLETTFINAWRNVVNSIRAGGATAVQFDWSVNKGNQGNTNAWAAYPGDAYVDIIGVDFYDHWSPSFNDAQFASNRAQVPSLDDVLAKCIAANKQIALDEWGVSHNGPNGGDDNPFYIQKIWDWLNANASRIAYETTYDDLGSDNDFGGKLTHNLSPPIGTSSNPNSSALYKSLWGSTTPQPPAAPTNLIASIGNTQVTLSWTASTGNPTSYEVFRGTSPNGQGTTPIATGITALSYVNTGLTNGTQYYYTVKARNAGGLSGNSNEVPATPSGSQPLPNGNYTLAPANATGMRLQTTGTTNGSNVNIGTASSSSTQQWNLTSSGTTTYTLFPVSTLSQALDVNGQSTASGANVQTWQYLGQANQKWTLTAVPGGYTLTPTHASAVRLNATGTSDGSNVNQLTANGSTAQTWNIVMIGSPPNAPTNLTASAANAQITLSWSASTGNPTSYEVFRGTSANNESPTPIATGITGVSYVDTGLSNGTTYYYKVKARNAIGLSVDSNEAFATPTVNQPLPNGNYTLAPANATGMRLQTTGTTNGSNVNVGTASSSTTQQWNLTSVGGATYTLFPVSTLSQALDVNGQLTTSGTNVQTWQYLGQANQKWTLTAVSGGYTLTPTHATAMRLNATGTSDGSNVNQLTADGSTAQTWNIVIVGSPPNAPTNLTATAGNTQITLSWSASTGNPTSYEVFRGTSANNESPTPIATGITGLSYVNTGLSNGTSYYYKVKARNANGLSIDSNEAFATPVGSGNTHAGTWAAKGIIPTTASYTGLYQQSASAQNTAYVAKIWVKGSGNFIIKTLNSSWVTILETTFTASSTWTEKSISFTTPNTASPGVILFLADAGGGGTLYLDDAFMGVNGGTNVLTNPGFESGNTVWTVGTPVWSIVQNP
jgi:fibronectin type 3 domain-containing protein